MKIAVKVHTGGLNDTSLLIMKHVELLVATKHTLDHSISLTASIGDLLLILIIKHILLLVVMVRINT